MKTLFCFGFGYTADYMLHALEGRENWRICGTTRSEEKREELIKKGIDAYIFDYKKPLPAPEKLFRNVTHVLISTPPDDEGDPSFLMHTNDLLNASNIEWVGYLSTTGVYGDRDGGSVTEQDELRPTSKRGSRRKLAEKQWLSLCPDIPVHIFRLAGIYGPGRCALDSVRAGMARRIFKEGHAFGRIHVEDIVNVILKSFNHINPCEKYNVCDDLPAPSHEVIEYACQLLKTPAPPIVNFEDANLAPMTRSFYMDNRRVKNDKIKTDLNVSLKYPTYKEGLKACLEAENYAVSMFKNLTLKKY